jgi:hypothetical protein
VAGIVVWCNFGAIGDGDIEGETRVEKTIDQDDVVDPRN